MKSAWMWSTAASLLVACLAPACGSNQQLCVPGAVSECPCLGGQRGVQTCQADGKSWGSCLGCVAAPDGGKSDQGRPDQGRPDLGRLDLGWDLGRTDGKSTDSPPLKHDGPTAACGTSGVVHSSTSLVELFPIPDGLVVIEAQSISLVHRKGQVLQTVASPRQITAAAYDGQTLAVADMAMVLIYDPVSLSVLRQFDLLQSCASATIVSADRLVCGPSNDWDRVFDTYDLNTGKLLASSDKYTYNGIPMRRVPGTDYFVTVTVDSSPSDYHLYHVNAAGKAEYVGESPYHGDFAVTNAYAFDAQAVHLVSPTGLLLKVLGSNCSNPFSSDCFVKDGVLGTLKTNENFLALADDGSGSVFGIVSTGGYWAGCTTGCEAQKVDVASHLIVSKKTYAFAMDQIISTGFDAYCPSLVVGYRVSSGGGVLGSSFRVLSPGGVTGA